MLISDGDFSYAARKVVASVPDDVLDFFNALAHQAVLGDIADVKKGIVKRYVAARLEDGDVADWVRAGEYAALLEHVSKSAGERTETWSVNGRQVRRKVRRNELGRFGSRGVMDNTPGRASKPLFFGDDTVETRDVSQASLASARDILRDRDADKSAVHPKVRQAEKAGQLDETIRLGEAPSIELGMLQHQHQLLHDHFEQTATYYGINNPEDFNVHVRVGNDASGAAPRTVVVPLESFLSGGSKKSPIANIGDQVIEAWIEVAPGDANEQIEVSEELYGRAGGAAATQGTTAARGAQAFMDNRSDAQKLMRNRGMNGKGDESRLAAFARRLNAAAPWLGGVPGVGQVVSAAGRYDDLDSDFGDSVRQTAYRLRGTQVPMRAETSNGLKDAAEITAKPAAGLSVAGTIAARNGNRGDAFASDPAFGALNYHAGPDGGRKRSDALRLSVSGDTAAASLITDLPGDNEVRLMRESGMTPPSRGILIDADGDPVGESIGVGEDHFLPFTAKMLSQAQGGQYVRTRATGGLTVEDLSNLIYSGARRATVVSRSGVFTIELDPMMRGGRRYSDKAMGMMDRYRDMLATLDQEQTYLPQYDIPAARRAEIEEQARGNIGYGLSEEEFNVRYKKESERLLNEERRVKRNKPVELDEEQEASLNRLISRTVQEEMAGMSAEDRKKFRMADRIDELREELGNERVVRPLRLNTEGYGLALSALQQSFPQFIRSVSAESIPDFMKARRLGTTKYTQPPGERDSATGRKDGGYVGSGRLRSTSKAPSATPEKKTDEKKSEGGTGGTSSTEPTGGGSGPAGGGQQMTATNVSETPLGRATKISPSDVLSSTVRTIRDYAPQMNSDLSIPSRPDVNGVNRQPHEFSLKDVYRDPSDTNEAALWVLSCLSVNKLSKIDESRQQLQEMLADPVRRENFAADMHQFIVTLHEMDSKGEPIPTANAIVGSVIDALSGPVDFLPVRPDQKSLFERRMPTAFQPALEVRDEQTLVLALGKDPEVSAAYGELMQQASAELGDDAPVTITGIGEAFKKNRTVLAAQAKLFASTSDFKQRFPERANPSMVPTEKAIDELLKPPGADTLRPLRGSAQAKSAAADAVAMSPEEAKRTLDKYQLAWSYAVAARKLQLAGGVSNPKASSLHLRSGPTVVLEFEKAAAHPLSTVGMLAGLMSRLAVR